MTKSENETNSFPFTETDDANIADMIWWIKGYMAAKDIESEICDFGTYHIKSLKRARNALKERWIK